MLSATQLTLVGITSKPLIDYAGPDKRAEIVSKTIFDRAIQRGNSPIDMMLVRLVCGLVHQEKKEYAEAEKYLSVLFEDDTFFSPLAGIHLARCKKDQGLADQANKILDEVAAKYPGCKPLVSEVQQSWK